MKNDGEANGAGDTPDGRMSAKDVRLLDEMAEHIIVAYTRAREQVDTKSMMVLERALVSIARRLQKAIE